MTEPSRFLTFLPDSSSFFLIFPPNFGNFFAVRSGTLSPLTPSGSATVAMPLLITLTVLLWVMQSHHTSPVRRIISLAGVNIPFIKYQ